MADELAAGRSATPIGLGQLDELEALNHAQQFAWLLPHALAAPQVTGIVVGHAQVQASLRSRQRDLHQDLVDVAHLAAERRGPLSPLGVVRQKLPVLLQRGAAGGAVGDDGLHLRLLEQRDVVACQFQDDLSLAIANRRHPTALDLSGGDDLALVAGQDPDRGRAGVGEHEALGTSQEEPNTAVGLSSGRRHLGQDLPQRSLR